ncbi:P-loop containing nucleoside triphosphate hydrolases superfamily protein [Perilla frutescens var. hirtella]|uniref:P-loop containing nucleoside triphosphate hydrolases superfamily protein n=1 Tax=Perilla frutescens var. hirtella TaxID=608512 RepID=A0AAD4JFT5_PERFH|nr:P-loop containing nucleoside triphosphate hydrolases superfamily protein [Perilla frutescens var. hirtella]
MLLSIRVISSEHPRHSSSLEAIYGCRNLLPKRKRSPTNKYDVVYIDDVVMRVQGALCETLSEFNGNLEEEGDLEDLIDQQLEALQKALKIPHKASEARMMLSKKFLTLFRTGKLGPFIRDPLSAIFHRLFFYS